MVGVAGKSKGCATCRRRKIRCDLQKPSCIRCTSTGRPCEGYERFPVFLNWSVDGLKKRTALEEVKPSIQSTEEEPGILPSPDSIVAHLTQRVKISNLSPTSHNILHSQIVSNFYDTFLPKTGATKPRDTAWLVEAIGYAHPTETMRMSLLALAVSRLGSLYNDQYAIIQGRTLYGRALRLLYRDLSDQRMVFSDATLASSHALAVHELFSSNISAASWSSHLSGITALIASAQGKVWAPLGQQVIQDSRHSIMARCLLNRKSFKDFDWRIISPHRSYDNCAQQVFTQGFAIASLMEDIDKLGKKRNKSSIPRQIHGYLIRLQCISATLSGLYQQVVDCVPGPLYSPSVSSLLPENEFHDLEIAMIFMNCWALQLIIGYLIDILCSWFGRQESEQILTLSLEETTFISTMMKTFDDSYCKHLAREISATVRFCMREDKRTAGPLISVLPLMVIMWYSQAKDYDEETGASELIRRMFEEKHIAFTTALLNDTPMPPAIMELPTTNS